MLARFIKFYGQSFQEVMDMPIRAFWKLNEMIDRIRAEEMLDWMPVFGTSMGGEHVQKVVNQLKERVGTPIIVEQLEMDEADRQKLKRFFG